MSALSEIKKVLKTLLEDQYNAGRLWALTGGGDDRECWNLLRRYRKYGIVDPERKIKEMCSKAYWRGLMDQHKIDSENGIWRPDGDKSKLPALSFCDRELIKVYQDYINE